MDRTNREVNPAVPGAAHLLRTALSYLPNYALVVKDRARTDEDVYVLERRYQARRHAPAVPAVPVRSRGEVIE